LIRARRRPSEVAGSVARRGSEDVGSLRFAGIARLRVVQLAVERIASEGAHYAVPLCSG
jgi:hypothetical protein